MTLAILFILACALFIWYGTLIVLSISTVIASAIVKNPKRVTVVAELSVVTVTFCYIMAYIFIL